MSDSIPAVELDGISKRFPGVVANNQVGLTVMPGEVHAIVGENGAGKSTLMKILYGMQRPDEGTIRVGGHDVHFRSPKDAIGAGIGMAAAGTGSDGEPDESRAEPRSGGKEPAW